MKLNLKIAGSRQEKKADVVLIHGTGSSGGMWRSQVDCLTARGHRCFTLDLRGHGDTDEPGESTDISIHRDDVLETLADSSIEFPAVFVGHSLGAIISLTLAVEKPETTSRIFLAALPGRVLPPVTVAFRLFLSGPHSAMSGSRITGRLPWRERTLLETNRFSLGQIVEHFSNLDLLNEDLAVSCPVHLSAGRFDPVAPCHYVEKIHRRIPGSTLKVFELGGHNFMDYHKESFNRWILEPMELDVK